MQKTRYFILIIALLICGQAVAGGKIMKWVDKNGKVHYGDRPPPQHSKRSVELNKSGVIKQREPAPASTQTTNNPSTSLSRADRALLASYSSVDEIDLALKRNTDIDKAVLDSLLQQRNKLESDALDNQQSQQAFTNKKLPVPKHLAAKAKKIDDKLDRVERKIKQRQQNIEQTTQRYMDDMQRYIELKVKELNIE